MVGVDGTDSGPCPVTDLDISGVEISGSATRESGNLKYSGR
jgi:hypothetical protein